MVDPATAMLIATAISTAAEGIGKRAASKRKGKETKRDTYAGLLEDALKRSTELEGHRLSSRAKLGKRSALNAQNTSDLVRGALSI